MQSQDDSGYTLLELLVAVAIMALASVPLAQSMSSGLKTWDRLHAVVSDSEQNLLLRARLAEWIGRAYPSDPLRTVGGISYSFDGDQSRVYFLTAVSPDTLSNAIYAVRLFLAPEGDLVVDISADYADAAGLAGETINNSTVLLSDVTTFELAYFQKQTLGGVWLDRWQSQLRPPDAIRIRIQAAIDNFKWPDLIIPIITEEWAHCAFDPVTQSCLSGADAG